MKKLNAIDDFLEAHARKQLTEEILNNLADALQPKGKRGRPANTLRQIWMLALRAIYTIEQQAILAGKTEREVMKFAKLARDDGWEVINKSKTPEGFDQVWISGNWDKQAIILVFTFNEVENRLLTSYFRMA